MTTPSLLSRGTRRGATGGSLVSQVRDGRPASASEICSSSFCDYQLLTGAPGLVVFETRESATDQGRRNACLALEWGSPLSKTGACQLIRLEAGPGLETTDSSPEGETKVAQGGSPGEIEELIRAPFRGGTECRGDENLCRPQEYLPYGNCCRFGSSFPGLKCGPSCSISHSSRP